MDFWEYCCEVQAYKTETNQRFGQAAFNVLVEVRPDISEKIRGSLKDPFYKDERLSEFFQYVQGEW